MMNRTPDCNTLLKKRRVAAYAQVILNPIERIPVIARGYDPSTTSSTRNMAATVRILIVLNWPTVSLAKSKVEAEAPPTSIVFLARDASELRRLVIRLRL